MWIIWHHYTERIISSYVLQFSGISKKSAALIVRYSQKKEWISIVFYYPSIPHNLWNTGPIHVGFSAKCTSLNQDFNQIENWKCHMFDFRPIPLDRITYFKTFSASTNPKKGKKSPSLSMAVLVGVRHIYFFMYDSTCVIKMKHHNPWYPSCLWTWNPLLA